MDQRLIELAKGSPNFGRLFDHSELLAIYGAQSEAIVFTDANGALVHTRQFGEVLAEWLVTRTGLRVAGPNQVHRLAALRKAGLLPPAADQYFFVLRDGGNKAAHRHVFDRARALEAIQAAFELGTWFYRLMTNDRSVIAFVPPVEPVTGDPAELAQLREAVARYREQLTESQLQLSEQADRALAQERARVDAESMVARATQRHEELRELVDSLNAEIAVLRQRHSREFATAQLHPRTVSSIDREQLVERALRPAPLNEAAARRVIDAMLIDAGWLVQDKDDLNPLAGAGVAVREFRLASGPADYVLYVDAKIVGVIEAKREGESLSAAHAQNARYADGVLKEHSRAVWRDDEPFAFRYASTGAETMFLNRLDPVPRSRFVFSFHRPETISGWMAEAEANPDAPTLRARFHTLPPLDTQGLRLAQVDAITGVEKSLREDRPRALVQMATGAGKTFAAVTEAYRILKYAKARRVLFLVDRNNLGRQALGEFRTYVPPDDGRKLSEIYNVDRLSGTGVAESSSVVISTIQKMYALLRGENVVLDDAADDEQDEQDATYDIDAPVEIAYNPEVPPESFDLIIVDECHRSIYGLWRGALEYFDAPIVGLTATPIKQTLGFFGQNLVSEYTYQMAVADGVNVDFQLVKLSTTIGSLGSLIEDGTTVRRRDRRTRAQRLEELDDDFAYTNRQLGRSVIAKDHIRTVLSVYRDNWESWFPGRVVVPKTLIFAADDNHAEDIVRHVKEVFGKGDEFVQKITYKVRKAGRNPDDLINALRNDANLRIAVTVDMIATGTDVRPLECVIFLRAVRSAVLFEQMKGRGARTLDPTELAEVTPGADEHTRKDQFVLLDAVGVTDSKLVDASPLGAPLSGDAEKRVSLRKLLDKCGSLSIDVDEAALLAGRLSRLEQRIDDTDKAELAELGGLTLPELAHRIVGAVSPDKQEEARLTGGKEAADRLVAEAVKPLTSNPEYRQRILAIRREYDITYDETSKDEILELRAVPASDRAQERVTSWHAYLEQHRDEITAIQAIGERGGGRGAYAALKQIAAQIRHPPFEWTPDVIWHAYDTLERAVGTPGIVAGIPDLVSLIRYELGLDSELRPYRDLVNERFEAWLLKQRQVGVTFTLDQVWWLEKIRDTIAVSVGIIHSDLTQVPFTERGGTTGFVTTFGGKDAAKTLIAELDRELA